MHQKLDAAASLFDHLSDVSYHFVLILLMQKVGYVSQWGGMDVGNGTCTYSFFVITRLQLQ